MRFNEMKFGAEWNPKQLFHPTDLSVISEFAFYHALKFTLLSRGSLEILHVGQRPTPTVWEQLPKVRATLARWGALPEDSPREALSDLGIAVRKEAATGPNPVVKILEHLDRNPAELIVLGTHWRRGVERFIYREVAMTVAKAGSGMTLFVPEGSEGFVSASSGEVQLKRILVPVDHHPSPDVALSALIWLSSFLSLQSASISFVYVGPAEAAPSVRRPVPGWTYATLFRTGDVADEILRAATEAASQLIIMSLGAPRGLSDTIRGSITEQVVRRSPCPVLVLKAEESEAAG